MQEVTKEKFSLAEVYAAKENELLDNENQLRILAKSDVGLSQKVIDLRKTIQADREALKQMQIKKLKLQEAHVKLLEDLQSCEHIERRRHDVALETEQAYLQVKEHLTDLQKELLFVNNNRKDLQTALHGLQQQNQMLDREL